MRRVGNTDVGVEESFKITCKVGNTSPRLGTVRREGPRRNHVRRSTAHDVGSGGKFWETVAKFYGGRQLTVSGGLRRCLVQIFFEGDLSPASGAHVRRNRVGPTGLTAGALGMITEGFSAARTIPDHVVIAGRGDTSAVGSQRRSRDRVPSQR